MAREIKRLGDLLVELGKITDRELKEALNKQKNTGKRLGEILTDEGYITEEDIIDVLEIQLGIQRVYLDFVDIDFKLTKLVPERLARKHTLVPTAIIGDKIEVAMADPLNIFAQDDVRISSGYEVNPLIATRDEIVKVIDKLYSGEKVERAAEEFSREHKLKVEKEENEHLNEIEDISNAPIVKLVDLILSDAINSKSSDIHIEPFEKYIKIRYRIDGVLYEQKRLPIESQGALITRIKILSNMNIAEKRIPQDGRMKIEYKGKYVDLRVSVLPTINGEKVVIRILKNDSVTVGKEKLGMNELEIKLLENMIKIPYGIILVTGPTGSGKSTTLYTILNELNDNYKNIITVEDPVEYMLEGVNQVNVNNKAGLTFASGLRSILRQDPDIVMIGEMRDNETAEIAARAAITGHLVLSTIHTNDAPSSIMRLIDMGIEPYLAATALGGIIAQRLVRTVCTNCKESYDASNYEKEVLEIDKNEQIKLYKGKGCPQCHGTGYHGRTGVYEMMEITKEHRELIMNGASADELKKLSVENNMQTIRKACEKLVIRGITTFDELVKTAFLKE
ncbi:type IV pilus assembly protein PilB [Clostridium acidisoli DSM 12555]|uniref:Type IV pilus assembly protein PilB n=1 Tax=Clostridium acidisoli DSM 12555 TaxID=1121291 RepID=A0A1W1XK93_9CLOT|nr:ATPase, T2SS/T4P/T4SS family [Clostridium acidisoli]SMC24410.1 type IV pilus assembly protein PilB [Clostridium acidisoli DSM 12555]